MFSVNMKTTVNRIKKEFVNTLPKEFKDVPIADNTILGLKLSLH